VDVAEIILLEDQTGGEAPTHRLSAMSSASGGGPGRQGMESVPNPVVHLELRTGNLGCACEFYARLFGWRTEVVRTGSGDYLTLALGERLEGGVVEHETERAFWLPYVEVDDVAESTERARQLGASICLSPREGPAGWRSVLSAPASGMIALWQPKT
jgi:uncharacterized protein